MVIFSCFYLDVISIFDFFSFLQHFDRFTWTVSDCYYPIKNNATSRDYSVSCRVIMTSGEDAKSLSNVLDENRGLSQFSKTCKSLKSLTEYDK